MIKQLCLILLALLVLSLTSYIWAKSNKTLLVLDSRNRLELPRYFRSTDQPLPKEIDATGFKELHACGSGQFSKLGLSKALPLIPSSNITFVDLRQESHGFLNGNAVSWYGYRNADNSKLTPVEIETTQTSLLANIAKEEEMTVFRIMSKKNGSVERVKPIDFAVHQILSEAELLQQLQIPYQRIYVQDHHAASREQVDRFVAFIKTRGADDWLYFHCRAGRGRTTLFMTMYDMLRNAKQVSFENILKRQIAIGGKDLSEMPNKTAYKYRSSESRYEFLKRFYQYARTNKDNYETSWSSWLAKNGSQRHSRG